MSKKVKYQPLFLVLIILMISIQCFTGNTYHKNISSPSNHADPVLNLIIIWHQHQPSYQDPETGIYEQPWVFMHGINSYPYMADVLNDYPDINVTINLTPSMLKQLNDYIDEVAYDRRLEIAKMDEASMSDENKSIVLQYFFDINSQFRQNGTRYFQLSERRNSYQTLQEAINGFTAQEYRDLKTLFIAHWINPRYTTEMPYNPPFNPLGFTQQVLSRDASGIGGYTTTEKNNVITYAYSIVKQAITMHSQIQNEGRLEIITTPFYHPILPLLINVTNAREVNEGVINLPLPNQNTLWTEDALTQIQKGRNYTAELFGKTPVGMWPSEEAVSDEIIPLVNQSNIEWFVSDYTVLKNSLGVSALTPAQWFKPYRVEKDGNSSVVFFRHQQLSDEIGFNYGGLDPETAAENMTTLLHNIQQTWIGSDDPVFTVALDGENAWENYQYNIDGDPQVEYTGNLFREYMYQKLEEAQDAGWLRTITPRQYLAEHPAETLDQLNLATGSWAGDLNVWIGEADENQAWDRLITARSDLVEYMDNNTLTKEDIPEAWEALYAAEGSDWFWWYGADKDSGHDELFDWQFKTILRGMYKKIGWTDTEILNKYPYLYLKMLPAVPARIQGKVLPTIDGIVTSSNEWNLGAVYHHALANSSTSFFKDLYLLVDENLDKLHFRVDTTDAYPLNAITDQRIGLYFSKPGSQYSSIFPLYADESNSDKILGFELSSAVLIDIQTESVEFYHVNSSYEWEESTGVATLAKDTILEISIPLTELGVQKGQQILIRAVVTNETTEENWEVSPQDGPWSLSIPFGGVDMTEVFLMTDPAFDEHGIYPTNSQMHPDYNVSKTGLMDILQFRTGYKDDRVYFEFKFRELFNPWGGPGGYSHPLMQVYIDKDNIPGSGKTTCDQNGHFTIETNHAWEVMVRADAWLQYTLLSDDTQLGGVTTFCDTVDRIIVYSAPISAVGTPTTDWWYTVVVGSQDFQAFREFYVVEQEWKFGGGDDTGWDPNVVDCLVPEGVNQTEVLAGYDKIAGQFCTIPAVSGVTDTEAPSISILNEVTTYRLASGETTKTVTLEWNASDNIALAKFVIYDNEVLVTELGTDIRNLDLNLTQGTHNITVYAFDTADNTDMASIFFTINATMGISGFSGMTFGIFSFLSLIGLIIIIRSKK